MLTARILRSESVCLAALVMILLAAVVALLAAVIQVAVETAAVAAAVNVLKSVSSKQLTYDALSVRRECDYELIHQISSHKQV
jgi:hypothetical protein